MQTARSGFIVAMAAACIAGCAGNGQGLDQNGQPIAGSGSGGSGGSGSTGTVTPDLQSIEDNVFTPICSKCHIGGGAPEGLQLDAAHAYELLVDVPSQEQPSLSRVKPGDPDDSYMVRKIEGLPGIDGGQMPLGETPLPQATINAIRQWITDGAPNVPASAGATSAAFAVSSTFPADGSTVSTPVSTVMVAFTHELDATLVNETTVAMESMADAQSGASAPLPAHFKVAEHNARVLLWTPGAPLAAGRYRLTLRGTGGGALADLSAVALGKDVSVQFTVGAAP
jgi:hypothetical protein